MRRSLIACCARAAAVLLVPASLSVAAGPEASIRLAGDIPADCPGVLGVGTTLFSDRSYTMAECPPELEGKAFLRASISGSWFQCTQPGEIRVLTPNPNDSKDSAAAALLEQGFARSPQDPFQLMLKGSANRVEVYRKTLEKGEWTKVPKWGVVAGLDEVTRFDPPLYMNPPQVVANPTKAYAPSSRRRQGISSMAVVPGGRLWATWYAGITPGEDHNNYVLVATSGNDGKTWTESLVIDPDAGGPVRAFDPELWVDPDGRLWMFWAQTIGHDGKVAGVWAMTNDHPGKEGSGWSRPRRLTDGVMMCKPIVLSSGEWVMPASTWRETDDSARVVVSVDKGQTWILRGACHVPKEVRNYDEHMIVERKDQSLWMLIRTRYGIGESISTDRGETWSPLVPSDIEHTVSRFFIWRLASGNLLLVKHGGIHEKTKRSHLTAFVSLDDGKTWEGGLLLDERKRVSYPDGMQGDDGKIYITYDRSRSGDMEILMARFSEEDILEGKLVTPGSRLRMLISQGIRN